jgi:hypothetical protein
VRLIKAPVERGNEEAPSPKMSSEQSQKEAQGIQSMELGLRLLTVLATARGPMALRDLSAAAGVSPSKAHR